MGLDWFFVCFCFVLFCFPSCSLRILDLFFLGPRTIREPFSSYELPSLSEAGSMRTRMCLHILLP